jgi:hypothetical protein
MKTPLLALALIATFAATTAHAREFLTPKEAKDVLADIDDHASDAWDESDHEYTYDKIVCESETKTCVVSYRSRYQDGDQFTGGGSDPRNLAKHPWGKTQECKFVRVSTVKDVLDSDYDQMDKCISGS